MAIVNGPTQLGKTLLGLCEILLPVSGAGSNIPIGTLMQPGVTGGTNYSIAIPAVATVGDVSERHVGVLTEKHIYSGTGSSGDATTATLVNFYPGYSTQIVPSHMIALPAPCNMVRLSYATTNVISVASATSTVLTITSTEANLDGAFAFVTAGLDIGELVFVKSSTTGAWTLSSASSVTMDSTSRVLKILPLFHEKPTFLINTATVGTLLDSVAAIGTARGINMGSYIIRNGLEQRLDPLAHHKTTGLDKVSALDFYSLYSLQNSIFCPNS